jgi:hypothetical protein
VTDASKPDPTLRLELKNAATNAVLAVIEARLPAELSLRTAFMCALDLIGKKLKPAVTEALKGLGFK